MVALAVVYRPEISGPGPEQLFSSVKEVMRVIVRHLEPDLEKEGISTGQFWALHQLSSLQAASLSTVARHLAVSAPTLCANVDSLEKAGLVTRHRSQSDRRSVELSLTPKGRRVESRIWTRIGRVMTEAAGGLPPEDIATAVRVFQRLHQRLEPDGVRAAVRG